MRAGWLILVVCFLCVAVESAGFFTKAVTKIRKWPTTAALVHLKASMGS